MTDHLPTRSTAVGSMRRAGACAPPSQRLDPFSRLVSRRTTSAGATRRQADGRRRRQGRSGPRSPCCRPRRSARRPRVGVAGRGRGRAGAQLLAAARRPDRRRPEAPAPPDRVGALGRATAAILAGDALLALAHEVLLEARVAGRQAAGRRCCCDRDHPGADPRAGPGPGLRERSDVTLDECLDMAARQDRRAARGAAPRSAPSWPARRRSSVDALTSVRLPARARVPGRRRRARHLGRPEVTGKPVCSDLRSHKKTLAGHVARSITAATPGGELARLAVPRRQSDARTSSGTPPSSIERGRWPATGRWPGGAATASVWPSRLSTAPSSTTSPAGAGSA